MNEHKKRPKYPLQEGVVNLIGLTHWDPFGSYTGRPVEKTEKPVQDADDL